jgi:hypothetical protein
MQTAEAGPSHAREGDADEAGPSQARDGGVDEAGPSQARDGGVAVDGSSQARDGGIAEAGPSYAREGGVDDAGSRQVILVDEESIVGKCKRLGGRRRVSSGKGKRMWTKAPWKFCLLLWVMP